MLGEFSISPSLLLEIRTSSFLSFSFCTQDLPTAPLAPMISILPMNIYTFFIYFRFFFDLKEESS